MSDYMSLQQMQLIRDRLSADACGVGTVVSSDTFFYMCKRAAADLGVTDDALKKLISKIDENSDDQIQFAECRAVRKSTGGPRRADNVRGTAVRVDGVACLISFHFRTGSRTSLQAERRSSPARSWTRPKCVLFASDSRTTRSASARRSPSTHFS